MSVELDEREETEIKYNDDLLKKIEKAAKKGVRKSKWAERIIAIVLFVGLVAGIVFGGGYYVKTQFQSMFTLENLLSTAGDIEGHDLTLNNKGIFGYTVADFQNAVIENTQKEKKLVVYSADVSDIVTIEEAGLFKLDIFSKHQMIKYNGTVQYYIDLKEITKKDIIVNEEAKEITMYIPHVKQDKINIPEEKIEADKLEKGKLAFGQIEITVEEYKEIGSKARSQMIKKLNDDKVNEKADEVAKDIVLETYQPIIKNLSLDYSLQIEFQE